MVFIVQKKSGDKDAQWEPIVQSAAINKKGALIRFGKWLEESNWSPGDYYTFRARWYSPEEDKKETP